MNTKRFPILAAVALVAIAIAVFVVMRRAPEAEGSLVGGPVLPGLADKLNDVSSVRFVKAGETTFMTLDRADDGWTIAERDGYPADPAKVRLALINLGETKVLEPKTADPERYAQLGVQDLDQSGAEGTRVELGGDGVDARLIVGKASSQGEGTYVRHVGEAQSLLATGNLVPDPEISAWLRREIVDIPSTRIREIELAQGDGAPFRVYKDAEGDANFKVADVPRGREVQSDYVANGLASMFSGLTLEDVARDSDDARGDATLHRATYRMFDGLVVHLEAWRHAADSEEAGGEGKAFMRLSVDLDEERARAKVVADLEREQADAAAAAQSGHEDDAAPDAVSVGEDASSGMATSDASVGEMPAVPGDATAADGDEPATQVDVEARTNERLAELRTERDELNARVQGWVFEIPAFKFGNVDKTLDDMLKPTE